jgi:hypothetical protein
MIFQRPVGIVKDRQCVTCRFGSSWAGAASNMVIMTNGEYQQIGKALIHRTICGRLNMTQDYVGQSHSFSTVDEAITELRRYYNYVDHDTLVTHVVFTPISFHPRDPIPMEWLEVVPTTGKPEFRYLTELEAANLQ